MDVSKRKAELWEKKIPELVEIGKSAGLRIGLKAKKATAINRIVKAESKKTSAQERPIVPEFETLTRGDVLAEDVAGKSEDAGRRGGYRPGAGRPLGMTDEKARMATLPQMPNPAIQGALCLAFAGWAKLSDCEELALSEDEAVKLALPYTQLAAYFGIDDHIPPWAMLGITASWNTWELVSARLAILKAKQDTQEKTKLFQKIDAVAADHGAGYVTEYDKPNA